jgi:hypothetical protein
MSNILTGFNNHFMEFLNDIQNVFPNDVDILTAKNALTAIRKANPKMIIKIWHSYICLKYNNEIENGNIEFFINKDYSNDLTDADSSDKIIEAIDRLRKPISEMDNTNQLKVMKYIQNLTKLANIYCS